MAEDIKYYGFVYITTNNINGKKYIGQKKYDQQGLWKTYLGSGIALKAAIEKYGKENFTKSIIEQCETKTILNEREKYWINYYNAVDSREFYNLAFGGDGGDTYSGHSIEEKERISHNKSISYKGKINLGAKNAMAKSVICLNNMKIFDTLVEAGKYANVNPEAISAAIIHRSNSYNAGKDPETNERLQWDWYDPNKTYSFKPFKREYKTGFIPGNAKKIKCIELNMIFNSIKDAAEYVHRSSATLSEALRKNYKCANMHWEYC